MNRRQLSLAVGLLSFAVPLAAHGQQLAKRFRIGGIGVGMPEGSAVHIDAFTQAMRELGHVEGGNIVYEWRWARGVPDRLPGIAAELVIPPGHGIANTRERLRALYGERASLEIAGRVEGGTIAILKVPYREIGQESQHEKGGVEGSDRR